ncbi:MAG TPA: O-antigen ligase family protein [Candidatus Kapabacteria bacterium]|nr:O-antigen ligase family protein [Candidatus Kapabacteria bacterium]
MFRTPRPYILLWSFAIPIYYLLFGFKTTYIPLGFTRVEAFSGFLPIVLSVMAYLKLTENERSRAFKYVPKVWLAFLIYYGASLMWSDNFGTGIRTFIQLAFPTVLFIIAFNSIQGDKHLDKYFKYLIILNALVAAFDLYYTVTGWGAIEHFGAKNDGAVGYRTVTAYFYTTLSIILLMQIMDKFKWSTFALFFVNVTLIVLAASRTPTVVFLAGAAVAVIMRRNVKFTVVGILGLSALIALILVLPSRQKFLTTDDNLNTRDSGRGFFQKYFRDKAEQGPLWGWGAGGTELQAKWITQNVTPVGAPHDEFLRIRYDGGIIGYYLFWAGLIHLLISGLLLGRYVKGYFHFKAVLVITPIMFAISCTNDNTFYYFYVFTQYLFVMMGFAARLAYEEKVALGKEHLTLTTEEEELVASFEPELVPAR